MLLEFLSPEVWLAAAARLHNGRIDDDIALLLDCRTYGWRFCAPQAHALRRLRMRSLEHEILTPSRARRQDGA